MAWRWLLVFGVALLAGADGDEKDEKKMQGTWSVVKGVRGGEEQPEEARKMMKVVIKEDVMSIVVGDRTPEAVTFTLDGTKKPKTIDMKPKKNAESKAALGIYELDGDSLKLAWRKAERERPKEFEPKEKDQSVVLLVLKREKEEK